MSFETPANAKAIEKLVNELGQKWLAWKYHETKTNLFGYVVY